MKISAKLFGILSLLVSSYFLQGCIFVPEGGGYHEHPHGYYDERRW